jgi:hypothetical protein
MAKNDLPKDSRDAFHIFDMVQNLTNLRTITYISDLIVGLDARTKGPSPLVGESDMSPESELSPKLRVLLLKFWI